MDLDETNLKLSSVQKCAERVLDIWGGGRGVSSPRTSTQPMVKMTKWKPAGAAPQAAPAPAPAEKKEIPHGAYAF